MSRKRTMVTMLLAACTLALAACAAGTAAHRDGRDREHHGSCVTCHRTADPASDGAGGFAGGMDPSAACLDCHHYEEGHHPVEVRPAGKYLKPPAEGLPLFDGKVRCLTCHRAHTDPAQNDLSSPPHLLRSGPYQDRRQFCFQCHDAEAYLKLDPHRMLDGNGAIRDLDGKQVCLFCHGVRPDTDGDPGSVTFRADVAFLCWRCHAPMAGTFLDGHYHAKPKKRTRHTMRRTEERENVALPLARDGVITCSTCHNPHQDGVITRSAAAAGADRTRRLRMPKEQICGGCHAS